ncbi:hypothetical protein HPP92_007638 [Vanilla planifolia]|uniref:Uncharacterized protein n=1 Tax=Vanilla planifolia TaxID=51239 RepID=A0A835V804_VANPL|nr:hypothetical protein HPP92_007638 [Vanilla planifolia]
MRKRPYPMMSISQQYPPRAITPVERRVMSIQIDDIVLEAFKRTKVNKIGGSPVAEHPSKKTVGGVNIRDVRFLFLKPVLFSGFRPIVLLL